MMMVVVISVSTWSAYVGTVKMMVGGSGVNNEGPVLFGDEENANIQALPTDSKP